MELRISRHDEDARVLLTLVGSVDLASRQQLIAAGTEAMQAMGSGEALRLDMGGVDFMDSTGIGALIELAHDAEGRGLRFEINEKSPRVRRVLEVTGLHDAWQPA